MPELPEVETIARDLDKELAGKTINLVNVAPSYSTTPKPEEFISLLLGATVLNVRRVAKVIIISFDNRDFHLTFHLAMTGRLLLRSKGESEDSHLRVRIRFTDLTELRFTDVRMFGYAKIISQTELEKLTGRYGPSPLDPSLTGAELLKLLRRRKTQIKRLLLEQEIIAGLGNIYANDSLWISKIHPEEQTTAITLAQAESLLEAMREILTESINHRGSTLADLMYVDIYGKAGTHQNHFRIYGRENEDCLRCKSKIAMTVIGGRSTFFCPLCQKLSTNNNPVQPGLI